MYYRVAIQVNASPTWQWKSTTLSSLLPVFQFLRRFHDLPQDHLRVFSSSSREEMDEQLKRENNGLESDSVTAAEFLQERMIGSQQVTSTTESIGSAVDERSSETVTHDMNVAGSPGGRQVGRDYEVGRVGFWNIMALVES